MSTKRMNCCVCGKDISDPIYIFSQFKHYIRKTTPEFLKKLMFNRGKHYNSLFYICYNCRKFNHESVLYLRHQNLRYRFSASTSRDILRYRMILKNKTFLIYRDFLNFKGGDVRVKGYWFTIDLNIYGAHFIYDLKTNNLIYNNEELKDSLTKMFVDSIIQKIFKIFEDNRKILLNLVAELPKRLKKFYRLSGGVEKKFFLEKYGTTNPTARIDKELNLDLGKILDFRDYIHESHAKKLEGNYFLVPGINNYWYRAKHENLPLKGLFFYCHIQNMGEVIHSSEIGEEVSEKDYYQIRNDVNQISACIVYEEIPEQR